MFHFPLLKVVCCTLDEHVIYHASLKMSYLEKLTKCSTWPDFSCAVSEWTKCHGRILLTAVALLLGYSRNQELSQVCRGIGHFHISLSLTVLTVLTWSIRSWVGKVLRHTLKAQKKAIEYKCMPGVLCGFIHSAELYICCTSGVPIPLVLMLYSVRFQTSVYWLCFKITKILWREHNKTE